MHPEVAPVTRSQVRRAVRPTLAGCVAMTLVAWLCVTVLAARPAAAAGISRVQAPSPATFGFNVSTASPSWSAPTTPGNLLIAVLAMRWAGGMGVTAPAGWIDLITASPFSGESQVRMWYIPGASSRSGSETFTFTSGTTYQGAIALFEYSGVASVAPLDVTAVSTGTSATPTTGTTGITTAAEELWFAAIDVTGAYAQSAPTNMFTMIGNTMVGSQSSGMSAAWLERIASAPGAAGTSTTISAAREYSGAVVTFKGATAAPPPACPPVQPGVVACLTPGSEVVRQTVRIVSVGQTGPQHQVAGYVDAYRFTVAGITTTLPCVSLVADAAAPNPCAAAGGTFVSRTSVLVDQTVAEPVVSPGPAIATVRVCTATLTLTVSGFGINSAPAYTIC